ncbi:MAG: hypothetical protein JXQ93_07590 [Flavobacteriaceae bacterium]
MRKKRRAQSHSNFGYYGFGNVGSVFNRKPKPVFEKIRTIYGDELERLDYKKKGNKFHQDLTQSDREAVRKKIRDTFKKQRKIEILKISLFIIVIIILIYIVYFLVYN